ncbi:hypothetical protein [Pannonibacter sp. SL95]|uniref:hypothetical protein n=1 Tax=Pannonibacter sp. SL95 TaxID=2995153 RepID=UPI0022727248|nr:hypothetical protein [Pannonibacter sp. SL95]MCY1707100.1 hypothetical protein [Pannonibacter sp. SL95]
MRLSHGIGCCNAPQHVQIRHGQKQRVSLDGSNDFGRAARIGGLNDALARFFPRHFFQKFDGWLPGRIACLTAGNFALQRIELILGKEVPQILVWIGAGRAGEEILRRVPAGMQRPEAADLGLDAFAVVLGSVIAQGAFIDAADLRIRGEHRVGQCLGCRGERLGAGRERAAKPMDEQRSSKKKTGSHQHSGYLCLTAMRASALKVAG